MKAKTDSKHGKVEILVVEDSPTQAEKLKYFLEREGFGVKTAGDGNQALTILGESKPTMIITDIVMPGMNGYELCKRIKSDESTMEIPVILLTSLTSSEDVLEGLACGADNFITKPYSEEYLLSIIERIHASGKIRKSERVRIGVEITIGGERRFITADQQQMLSLLLSTYEAAVQRNIELTQAQEQLRSFNERLEELVRERTAELSREIIERKGAEERERHLNVVLRSIRAVNQLIVRENRRNRLIEKACDKLVNAGGFNGIWVVLTGRFPDHVEAVQKGFQEEAFSDLVRLFKKGIMPPCFDRAQPSSGIITNRNPSEECKDCPLANAHKKAIAISAKILYEGRYFGCMGFLVTPAYAADDEEISLLEEIVGDIAFALYNMELEEEKDKIEAQLFQSQKLESIGRLTSGIAHDFNNLLTTIIGNAEMAVMDIKRDEPLFEIMQEIKEAVNRAAGLTRQLLAFSRKQILQPELMNLNNVIHEMDKMLRRIIGEDIELETCQSPDLNPIEADFSQMEQIIMNLAVNSRDAMPAGGRLMIETKNVELDKDYARTHISVTPGSYVMLALSDTGVGMTKEVQAQVFEPFFTTKDKGKGTGLGLSTVYGIVKQSNGNIWVYSEPDRGTTFKIYLPVAGKTVYEGDRIKKDEAEDLSGSETVLMVEDDESLRRMAIKALEKYGYNVLSAMDGLEALRICEGHKDPIHIMVTDVIMPGMSGKELADRLKDLMPDLKILYMSGYTDNAIVHHGVLEKGISFLQKPFTPESLGRKVREVLNDLISNIQQGAVE